jgi:hypothetical protein
MTFSTASKKLYEKDLAWDGAEIFGTGQAEFREGMMTYLPGTPTPPARHIHGDMNVALAGQSGIRFANTAGQARKRPVRPGRDF